MNRKNVQELYDRLKTLREQDRERRFYMGDYICGARLPDGGYAEEITADPYKCGTAACLAGWAAMIANEQDPVQYPLAWIQGEAHEAGQQWLDLTEEQADHWFIAGWHPRVETGIIELADVTLDDALAFLAKALTGRRAKVNLANDELADAI